MADTQSVRAVKALFKNKSADHTISAATLADALDRDGKTLRAHLRAAHTRSAELKNSNWQITREVALESADWSDSAKRVQRTQEDDAS